MKELSKGKRNFAVMLHPPRTWVDTQLWSSGRLDESVDIIDSKKRVRYCKIIDYYATNIKFVDNDKVSFKVPGIIGDDIIPFQNKWIKSNSTYADILIISVDPKTKMLDRTVLCYGARPASHEELTEDAYGETYIELVFSCTFVECDAVNNMGQEYVNMYKRWDEQLSTTSDNIDELTITEVKQVGQKIVGRCGNKSVIAKIIPGHLMQGTDDNISIDMKDANSIKIDDACKTEEILPNIDYFYIFDRARSITSRYPLIIKDEHDNLVINYDVMKKFMNRDDVEFIIKIYIARCSSTEAIFKTHQVRICDDNTMIIGDKPGESFMSFSTKMWTKVEGAKIIINHLKRNKE